MPNHSGERRLWPPDSDNEADLVELLGLKPEQLVPMAPRGQPKAKRHKLGDRTEPFIHVALAAFLAGARALDGAQELVVWAYILREGHIRQASGQSETFTLTTVSLPGWITRSTKARALRKLAAAGLIALERDGQSSPKVRICARD
jgi:hypothetical protein